MAFPKNKNVAQDDATAIELIERLTPPEVRMLETGSDFFAKGDELEKLRQRCIELWPRIRNEFLRRYAERHPGRRPWAWWQLDCPPGERRRAIDDEHPFDDPRYPESRKKLYYGLPCCYAIIPGDHLVRFESSAAFLDRLGALLPGERERLPEAWAEPVFPLGDADRG